MELIDRYVNDVGRRLPRKQRTDVREELRSTLYDTLDSRVEGEPTEGDVVRLLEELGSPERVAASYRPSSQYLIGPALYPTFRMVVGIVLAVLPAVLVATFAVSLFFHPPEMVAVGERIFGLFAGLAQAGLNAFGVIVVVFAVLQRFEVRPDEPEEDWNPRDLPVVHDTDVMGRGEAVAGIVFPAIFLVLLVVFRDRIGLVVTPGQEPLLNDVVRANLPWLSASLLLGMALHGLLLWRGRWHWYTRLANFAIDLFGVYVLYRIAVDIAAHKATLVEAGLPGPLPAMIPLLAWGLVVLVGVLVVAEGAKVLFQAISRRLTESEA
jgi:hypothetical protein